jgi:hypothetical protein
MGGAMLKLNSIIGLLFVIINFQTTFSQTNLYFNLKESIPLPGTTVLDLSIIDYNGDGFPDYAYRDASMAYVINGINRNIIANFPIPSGALKIRFGDINQDGTADIAVAGRYPQSSDTSFAIIYDGIDFDSIAGVTILKPDDISDQYPVEMLLGQYLNRNIIILGLRTSIDSVDPPFRFNQQHGRQIICTYENLSLNIISDQNTDGYIKNILPYDYNFPEGNSYIAFRTLAQFLGYSHYSGLWTYDWANLLLMDSSLALTDIWRSHSVLGQNDMVSQILIGKPGLTQNDLILILYCDSLVCLNNPAGEMLWSKQLDIYGYHIALVKMTDLYDKSLFLFSNYSWLISRFINPNSGQIGDSGQVIGSVGSYLCLNDQENDGVDEFYFLNQNAVYIYNLTMGSGIDDDKSILPNNYCSVSNYPNPFNSSTEIQFELLQPFQVNLKIYNIEGRETAILLDDYLNSGKYYIKWDAKNVPSGIYFARLAANNNITTHKLILLK